MSYPIPYRLICILTFLSLALIACQPASPGRIPTEESQLQAVTSLTQTLSETILPPSAAPEATAIGPSGSDGLTFEELMKLTPPAPIELQANRTADGVQLSWKPAPVPALEHRYSDVVDHYNIYRRTGTSTDLVLIGTAEDTSYLDVTAKAGKHYYYSVSAVHEGPVEGQRTDEVGVMP